MCKAIISESLRPSLWVFGGLKYVVANAPLQAPDPAEYKKNGSVCSHSDAGVTLIKIDKCGARNERALSHNRRWDASPPSRMSDVTSEVPKGVVNWNGETVHSAATF